MIPVPFLISVDACYTDVRSDVELALLVEKGHDVLLDDVGTSSPHFIRFILFDDLNDLVDAFNNLNTCPSVCVLAWFDKPSIAFFCLETMFELLILYLLLLIFDEFSTFLILFLEFEKFFIVEISHMKGHWNVFERIDLLGIIVIFEIHEERFFVGKVPVVGKMVVDAEVI